jgi:predicted Zn-dependent protease with MMP-like domain
MVPPDKISIFQRSIESICRNDDEIVKEVGKVVRHEIAHHFGIGDARLSEIEKAKTDESGQ